MFTIGHRTRLSSDETVSFAAFRLQPPNLIPSRFWNRNKNLPPTPYVYPFSSTENLVQRYFDVTDPRNTDESNNNKKSKTKTRHTAVGDRRTDKQSPRTGLNFELPFNTSSNDQRKKPWKVLEGTRRLLSSWWTRDLRQVFFCAVFFRGRSNLDDFFFAVVVELSDPAVCHQVNVFFSNT